MIPMAVEGNEEKTRAFVLKVWLDRATHGLCAQAQQRLHREITAHRDDAVAHLMESGLSADAANAQAMEGLGDADKANKALRRTYLTMWQQRLLAGLSQPPKPMEKGDYGNIMIVASFLPLLTFASVWFECFRHSSNKSVGYAIAFGVILAFALLYGFSTLRRRVGNRMRRGAGRVPLPERATVMNRPYPWFLLACCLWVYAAWRVGYQTLHFEWTGTQDWVYWTFLLRYLMPRINRSVGASCFDLSAPRTPQRTMLTVLYIFLLAFGSIACLAWPFSWALVQDTVRLFAGMPMRLTYLSSHWWRSQIGEIVFISVGGIALAFVLGIVAVRWTVGLYLLHKAGNGHVWVEAAEPPETPLGE